MITVRRLFAAASVAATFYASAASADIRWVVRGDFSDGATLSGDFALNAYGYLAAYNLSTSVGPGLAAETYVTGGSTQPGAAYVDFTPSGRELRLDFADSLGVPGPHDALLTTSFECQAFACNGPDAPQRFIVDGFASYVPEPVSWTLMMIGAGGVGFALRRQRRIPAA